VFCFFLLPLSFSSDNDSLKLIAHRGGVVDAKRIENNVAAIEEAIRRSYEMREVDIRESKDGQLVVHHDATLRRFYGDGRALSELTWEAIQTLRSDPGQQAPLSFKQYAALCRGRIKLMLDTKGPVIMSHRLLKPWSESYAITTRWTRLWSLARNNPSVTLPARPKSVSASTPCGPRLRKKRMSLRSFFVGAWQGHR